MVRRIGVITDGGDCPGLNAVIKAMVRKLAIKYDYEIVKRDKDGINASFR